MFNLNTRTKRNTIKTVQIINRVQCGVFVVSDIVRDKQ